ncbi:MAG: hypothetical protein HKL84_07280 [Acidimicrobiaceae bacterium]|nr:hypothetical protein [Acidimicrobiaceae bacterium]
MNKFSQSHAVQIGTAYREILSKGLKASGGRIFEVVGVSKTFPVDTILAAYQAGIRNFGENYADELLMKASSPSLRFDQEPIKWHFLGAIQSRWINKLAEYVSVWHSVSRAKEIEQIAKVSPGAEIFIQVDFSNAKGRNGIGLDDAEGLVNLSRENGLRLLGLMVVPPLVDRISLGHIFSAVNDERLRLGLCGCSMGMSDDFELALAMGSTHIRVGRVLFGNRSNAVILGSNINKSQGGPR